MATKYSTLTKKEMISDIRVMQKASAEINSSPRKARAFLIAAGILTKSGKGLASQYR